VAATTSASACISICRNSDLMSLNPGNPEQSDLLEKLETIKLLCQQLLAHTRALPETEENTDLLRTAGLMEEIDFDLILSGAAELFNNSSAESAIEKFKSEIALRDQKVHEFKLSLADSVVEHKNTQKSLQAANEKIASLSTQISQMQLHSKELSLKLSTATTNLASRENELETAKRELDDLRTRNYHLKNQTAEYEGHLKRAQEELASTTEEHNNSLVAMDKACRDLEHVLTSNREMKKSLELHELQAREFIETIDSLQKERNHLQARLDAILTGINRTVVYDQSANISREANTNTVLEPANLMPYLPFCFPERLPTAIKFRREISRSFPAAASRRTHRIPPVFADISRTIRPVKEAIRTQLRVPRVTDGRMQEISVEPSTLEPRNPDFSLLTDFIKTGAPRTPERLKFSTIESVVDARQMWWQKSMRLARQTLLFPPTPDFDICRDSFDLFMRFIIATFVRTPYLQTNAIVQHQIKVQKTGNSRCEPQHANNLNEMLAFRHSLQLKSPKLDMPATKVVHSFKKGNKLKSVLETFGNAISSIVHKFEDIPDLRSGNGENK